MQYKCCVVTTEHIVRSTHQENKKISYLHFVHHLSIIFYLKVGPLAGRCALEKEFVLCCGSSQDGRDVFIERAFADCRLLMSGCYFSSL